MRVRGWCAGWAAAAALIAVGLSGCSGEPASPIESEPWTPPPPVFASKEEALEAGRAAYQRYLDLSNQIGAEGGKDPQRLEELMTPELADEAISGFDSLAAEGRKVEGPTALRKSSLVRYDNWLVQLYVCLDVSSTRLIDRSGADITAPDRGDLVALVVSYDVDEAGILTMSGSDPWTGLDNDIC